MDNFLETYSLPKLNQEEIDHSNRLITRKETEYLMKNTPYKQNPGPEGFTGEFYERMKNLYISFLNFCKMLKNKTPPKAFYESTITLIPKSEKNTTKN